MVVISITSFQAGSIAIYTIRSALHVILGASMRARSVFTAIALLFSCSAYAGSPIPTELKTGFGAGWVSSERLDTALLAISAKHYLSPDRAVQGMLGVLPYYGVYSGPEVPKVAIGVDYLQELFQFDLQKWNPNGGVHFVSVGGGGRVELVENRVIGVGLSGVVEWGTRSPNIPIEFIAEWRPTITLSEELDPVVVQTWIDPFLVGVWLRFYFM